MHKDKVYVPKSRELRKMVLKEMHNVPYVGRLGYQNTIVSMRKQYYWPGMKNGIAEYIFICMECQRVNWNIDT